MIVRRWIVAVLAVAALAACDPNTPAKPNNLVGVAPSAEASPSESPSPSPSASPTPSAEIPTTAAAVPTPPPPTPAATTKKPAPAKTTTKPPAPKTTPPAGNPVGNVHPGAFCSPEGAIGYTSAGTRMRCTLKAGEKQPRWRAA
ncbi:hypothetical protein ABT369_03785 [Dactylosporangium sp. NPDC000244]|uniref:hypothetical protein n=1 Tax=Dactylosporangium sp. NPDC000244 TaxID=3154365 RepID=UPI00332948E1